MKRSKAYRAAAEKIDRDALYSPLQAVKLAKETSTTKYDATVEVAMRLGVDPRKADQMVRGTVNLPHGTGKTARVIVFAPVSGPPRPRPPAPTGSAPTT
jgi:large subunit ribosomal protein L1